MRVVLASLAAAAILVPVAAAASPGFIEQPRLAMIASEVAGHPVDVLCTTDPQAWAAETRKLAVPPPGLPLSKVLGFTVDPTIYLGPAICKPLEWTRPNYTSFRAMNLLGAAVDLLLHEVGIARGIADGGPTECYALSIAPRVLNTDFLPRKVVTRPLTSKAAKRRNRLVRASALRWLIEGAKLRHQAAIEASSFYRGPCDA